MEWILTTIPNAGIAKITEITIFQNQLLQCGFLQRLESPRVWWHPYLLHYYQILLVIYILETWLISTQSFGPTEMDSCDSLYFGNLARVLMNCSWRLVSVVQSSNKKWFWNSFFLSKTVLLLNSHFAGSSAFSSPILLVREPSFTRDDVFQPRLPEVFSQSTHQIPETADCNSEQK